MRKPKLRELREAVKAVVRGPYTAHFPNEPAPLPKAYRGRPRYNKDECVGCGACKEVCPADAIALEDITGEKPVRRLTLYLDGCIFCGQCQANCLTQKGVTLTNEYELSSLRRETLKEVVEKELLVCECCGEVIGARDHIVWLVKKLGPSAFSNPTLILTGFRNLQIVREKARAVSGELLPPRRAESFRVLCPKCRRKNTITLNIYL